MKPILLFLLGLFTFAPLNNAVADELYIPVDEDPENPPRGHKKRSRPMIQWCTIDTEARTVTTTLPLPVLTYYIIDEGEAVIVASDSPEEFAGGVAALPTGAYTLRLVTAESAYTGPLDIQ